MSVTIYDTANGSPITIEHMIDAKDAVASGKYSFNAPAPAPAPAPEPAPTPTPASKPIVVKEVKVEPVVEIVKEKVIEDPPKEEEVPIRKINPRLIRK